MANEPRKTTNPIRAERVEITSTRKGSLFAFALACVAFASIVLAIAVQNNIDDSPKPEGISTPATVVPPTMTPETKVTPALKLTLDLPALNDSQMYWKNIIQAMPRCPLCVGVDKPPIEFTDNEAVIVTALYLTECSYNPFDEWGNFKVNEIGARGCSQLMGNLITDENMWNPLVNIYDGLREIRRLIDANGGDILEAVRNYKGIADEEHADQANRIFSVIRIGG